MGVVSIAEIGRADVLFESGALGPTGVTWAELENQTVPGTNVSRFAFCGVKFKLDRPSQVSEIGGHFVGPTSSTFFGAIIALEDENDFPDSGGLSTDDVLGNTLLTFPTSSAETFGVLSLSLEPGWYAIAFGSGLFGTGGSGGAVRNGMDFDDPIYIAFQPQAVFGWVHLGSFPNHRFVVRGRFVPEPASLVLLLIALPTMVIVRRRNCP